MDGVAVSWSFFPAGMWFSSRAVYHGDGGVSGGGPEKALICKLICKLWREVGLALLRLLWAGAPLGGGLGFAHRYTQSQAVVAAYRGFL